MTGVRLVDHNGNGWPLKDRVCIAEDGHIPESVVLDVREQTSDNAGASAGGSKDAGLPPEQRRLVAGDDDDDAPEQSRSPRILRNLSRPWLCVSFLLYIFVVTWCVPTAVDCSHTGQLGLAAVRTHAVHIGMHASHSCRWDPQAVLHRVDPSGHGGRELAGGGPCLP